MALQSQMGSPQGYNYQAAKKQMPGTQGVPGQQTVQALSPQTTQRPPPYKSMGMPTFQMQGSQWPRNQSRAQGQGSQGPSHGNPFTSHLISDEFATAAELSGLSRAIEQSPSWQSRRAEQEARFNAGPGYGAAYGSGVLGDDEGRPASGTLQDHRAGWMAKHQIAPHGSLGSRAARENQKWKSRQRQRRNLRAELERTGELDRWNQGQAERAARSAAQLAQAPGGPPALRSAGPVSPPPFAFADPQSRRDRARSAPIAEERRIELGRLIGAGTPEQRSAMLAGEDLEAIYAMGPGSLGEVKTSYSQQHIEAQKHAILAGQQAREAWEKEKQERAAANLPDQLRKQEEDVAVYDHYAQGYAGGGYVKPQGYAGGGMARGTDTIPAMLTPGEFVVSRPAVRQIGLPNLLAMNAAGGGTNRPGVGPGGMYAQGGGRIVGTPSSVSDLQQRSRGLHRPGGWRGTQRPSPPRPQTPAKKSFQGANNRFLSDLAADYQDKFDEANQANIDRYDEMMEGFDNLQTSTLGDIDAANAAAASGYQNVLGGYNTLQNQVTGGFGNLQSSVLAGMDANAAANEGQYGQILGQYGDLRDRSLAGLDEASAASDAEYANILGGYGDLRDRTLSEMRDRYASNEAEYQNILGGYGDLRGRTLEEMRADEAAAEGRYTDMTGRYGDLRERTLAGMETLGQDQLAESRKAYDESLAGTVAQQASRGLGGTTVGASIKQGTDRGYQDAVRGIQESVLARKAAADMGLTQAQLGMEERFQGARTAAANRRYAADMGLTQAELGQATQFQSAREAAQARQVAADMGLTQAQLGAQTQFAGAREAAAARRAGMDVGLTQAQIGQAAAFQGRRESAQAQKIAAEMGISQAQLSAMMGIGQAQLGAQSQFVNQQQAAADRRASIEMGLTQAKLGAIERREDIAPNFNNLISIAQGMAAGGYGEGYAGSSDIKKLLSKLPAGMGDVNTPVHWGKFPRPKPSGKGEDYDKWESDYADWIAENIDADKGSGRGEWEHADPFTAGMRRETIAGQYADVAEKPLNPYEQLAAGLTQ